MVQALKQGEIDYARGISAPQFDALKGQDEHRHRQRHRERLHGARLQRLREGHRRWWRLHDGHARPRLPGRGRLRHRQAGPHRCRPERLRHARHRPWCRRSSPAGMPSRQSPRTFDIELAKQKLDGRRLHPRQRRQAARQGRQAAQPDASSCPTRRDTYSTAAQFIRDWWAAAGHQRRDASSTTPDTLDEPDAAAGGRPPGQGRLRPLHLGLGRRRRSELPAQHPDDQRDRLLERQPVVQRPLRRALQAPGLGHDGRGAEGLHGRDAAARLRRGPVSSSCSTTTPCTPIGPTRSGAGSRSRPSSGTPFFVLRADRLRLAHCPGAGGDADPGRDPGAGARPERRPAPTPATPATPASGRRQHAARRGRRAGPRRHRRGGVRPRAAARRTTPTRRHDRRGFCHVASQRDGSPAGDPSRVT